MNMSYQDYKMQVLMVMKAYFKDVKIDMRDIKSLYEKEVTLLAAVGELAHIGGAISYE